MVSSTQKFAIIADFWGIRLAHYPYDDDSSYDGFSGDGGGGGGGQQSSNNHRDDDDDDARNAINLAEWKQKLRLLKYGTNNNNAAEGAATAAAGAAAAAATRDVACEKCGKWYTTRSIMLRHMNHECGVEKKVLCPLCNKRFRRKWNLEQHLKRVHKLERPINVAARYTTS